jgi:hypothetical protein
VATNPRLRAEYLQEAPRQQRAARELTTKNAAAAAAAAAPLAPASPAGGT